MLPWERNVLNCDGCIHVWSSYCSYDVSWRGYLCTSHDAQNAMRALRDIYRWWHGWCLWWLQSYIERDLSATRIVQRAHVLTNKLCDAKMNWTCTSSPNHLGTSNVVRLTMSMEWGRHDVSFNTTAWFPMFSNHIMCSWHPGCRDHGFQSRTYTRHVERIRACCAPSQLHVIVWVNPTCSQHCTSLDVSIFLELYSDWFESSCGVLYQFLWKTLTAFWLYLEVLWRHCRRHTDPAALHHPPC